MDVEVDSKYICPVCCEVLKLPVKTPCDHIFCTICLHESLRRTSCCPVCRKGLEWMQCLKHSKLETEITKTTIVCHPCGQQLSLLHFNAHSVTCSKRKQNPPHQFVPISQTSKPPPQPLPNRSTFMCPICRIPNLDCDGLRDHCNTVHGNEKIKAVCPVCSSMPWGNPQQVSSDFISHLNLRHKFEYDTYVDYEQDDEEALEAAIEASLIQK